MDKDVYFVIFSQILDFVKWTNLRYYLTFLLMTSGTVTSLISSQDTVQQFYVCKLTAKQGRF